MRLRPIARLSLFAGVLAVVLTGCAAGPAAAPAPTPSTDAPTPTPTVETLVVGPAEMPPVPFSGDCSAMLTVDDIAEVTGHDMGTGTREESAIEANAGALSCRWTDGANRITSATVVPWAGLDVSALPSKYADAFAGDCRSDFCSWQGGDDHVWITVDFFDNWEQLPRESVDVWGDRLGARIMGRVAEASVGAWTRDRTGWWPTLDCDQIASAVGAQLGQPLTASTQGWEHRPPPWVALAHEASRVTSCALDTGDAAVFLTVMSGSGIEEWRNLEAWAADDLGVPGIESFSNEDIRSSYPSAAYALTDGINGAHITIAGGEDGFAIPARDLAVAVAAAASSGFE